ncbi:MULTISPECIES: hypothetical protein [Kitasatospora]|uniref:Integral membrane protein n=1 Tax=Kitasatospora cathayae TaxID=3004092 RepID=A0ABY7Q770_9ACTN|nr:hypothetical protein [Kitasatospora sp. HUAS 3-15]WBP88533.1 hypothetical protein O1G21_23600 [Kitasatospora sp. HUAS 3-15]
MDTRQDELRRDLDATLQARKELGKEYEDELVDSFMKRLDARLDARVDRSAAGRPDDYETDYRDRGRPRRGGWGARRSPTGLAVISMALGIPLTAINSSPGGAGFPALVVTWAGIVGVNLAAALGNRLNRAERRTRSDWD